jgi:hypothetical protein
MVPRVDRGHAIHDSAGRGRFVRDSAPQERKEAASDPQAEDSNPDGLSVPKTAASIDAWFESPGLQPLDRQRVVDGARVFCDRNATVEIDPLALSIPISDGVVPLDGAVSEYLNTVNKGSKRQIRP